MWVALYCGVQAPTRSIWWSPRFKSRRVDGVQKKAYRREDGVQEALNMPKLESMCNIFGNGLQPAKIECHVPDGVQEALNIPKLESMCNIIPKLESMCGIQQHLSLILNGTLTTGAIPSQIKQLKQFAFTNFLWSEGICWYRNWTVLFFKLQSVPLWAWNFWYLIVMIPMWWVKTFRNKSSWFIWSVQGNSTWFSITSIIHSINWAIFVIWRCPRYKTIVAKGWKVFASWGRLSSSSKTSEIAFVMSQTRWKNYAENSKSFSCFWMFHVSCISQKSFQRSS